MWTILPEDLNTNACIWQISPQQTDTYIILIYSNCLFCHHLHASVCVLMSVCLCTYMCLSVCVLICVCLSVYLYVSVCLCTYMCLYVCVLICVCLSVYNLHSNANASRTRLTPKLAQSSGGNNQHLSEMRFI